MFTKKYEIRSGAIRDAWEIDEMPVVFVSESENEIYAKLVELEDDEYIVREYLVIDYADGTSWEEKDLNSERVHTYGARSFKEAHSTWYAIEMDEEDNDWGYGTYSETKAKEMLIDAKADHPKARIAVIRTGSDPECIDLIEDVEFTIRGIRKYTGLSQQKFADRYNIPLRTVQNWEGNVNEPPVYLIQLLWRAVKEDFKPGA